jgi:hypothetical protein
MLLLAREHPRNSSPELTVRPKILTPLVDRGYHFLMKSYACFPDVELFSSERIHMAKYPLSDATKKPLVNSLMAVMLTISFSPSSGLVLKAFSTYYFISLPSTMNSSPSAVVATIFSSSSQTWSV